MHKNIRLYTYKSTYSNIYIFCFVCVSIVLYCAVARNDLIEIFKEYGHVAELAISNIQEQQSEIDSELNSDTKTRYVANDLTTRKNEIEKYNELKKYMQKLLNLYRSNKNLGLAQ